MLWTQRYQEEINAIVRAGGCCRVLGPRYQHKSKLMRATAASLGYSHEAVYISLRDIKNHSEEVFFGELAAAIAGRLDTTQIDVEWRVPRSPIELQRYLIEICGASHKNLALFLDDIEIAPPNLVASLLGTLRAVFSTLLSQPGSRLQIVICGSLRLSQVALDNVSRFEGISNLVLVNGLDSEERIALANFLCGRAGLTPTDEAFDKLVDLAGGDSSLIEHIINDAFDQIRREGGTTLHIDHLTNAVERFLEKPDFPVVTEAFRQIEGNVDLLSSALLLLSDEIPASEFPFDDDEIPSILELCGPFWETNNRYSVKGGLWKDLLKNRLTPLRVGRRYAALGEWEQAIEYLSRTLGGNLLDARSELYGVVIGAINSCDKEKQALNYLCMGLAAAFPLGDLRFFQKSGTAIKEHYSKQSAQNSPHPILFWERSKLTDPEILYGPDYSQDSDGDEVRYLLPLRKGQGIEDLLGLVSLSSRCLSKIPYERREELNQVVGFLQQAAKAIDIKRRYEDLLVGTGKRAQQLYVLNGVLTRILDRRDESEINIMRAILEAITHGWGLEFNRAMLFVPETRTGDLVGYLGVGHLTRADTEEEWESEPYDTQTTDEWLDSIFVDVEQKMRKHKKVRRKVRQVRIRHGSGVQDLLLRCFDDCKPLRSTPFNQLSGFSNSFEDIVKPPEEFAIIPLRSGKRMLGVLYVDDKYTGSHITRERFELLLAFTSQATLTIENARAFDAERKQREVLNRLLNVEEEINRLITIDLESLRQEIVKSARHLFGADCVVLHCLRYGLRKEQDTTESVTLYSCVEGHGRTKRSRISEIDALGERIIKQGLLVSPNIVSEAGLPNKTPNEDSGLVCCENVNTSVGLRLGPIDDPVSILVVNWHNPQSLTDEDLRMMEVFANFAAVALPSSYRYQQVNVQLNRRVAELRGLSNVLDTTLQFRSEEEIENYIAHTLETARDRTNASHNFLFRKEPEDRWKLYRLSSSGKLESTPSDFCPAAIALEAFEEGETKSIPSIDQLNNNQKFTPYQPNSNSALAIPIKVTSNSLAVLYLESIEARGFTEEQRKYLENVGSILAVTLQLVQRTEILRTLVTISMWLTEEENLANLLRFIVDRAMFALRTVSTITLYYIEPKRDQLLLGHMSGVRVKDAVQKYPPPETTVVDVVSRLQKPIFAKDVQTNEFLAGPFVKRENIRSTAAIPLIPDVSGDEQVGCMFFSYRYRHDFHEAEKDLLQLFAQQAALAIHGENLRQRAEEEVERSRGRELRENLATLASGLIHHINSAVADIPELFTEIEEKLASGEDFEAPLIDLRESVSKTSEINNRLRTLLVARKSRPKKILLSEVLTRAIEASQHEKPEHVHLEFDSETCDFEVIADNTWIQLLIENLLWNAYSSIPEDRAGKVEIEIQVELGDVLIYVRDNGRGIRPKYLDRVFEAWFSTNRDRHEIHGIGLFACLQIAKEHDGALTVESEIGKGTEFTLKLPGITKEDSEREINCA